MRITGRVQAKLAALFSELEREGCDDLSIELSDAIRGLHCAAAEEINVTSWDDFQKFWERNRGQQFVFLMIDEFGPDSPVVQKVKTLIEEQSKVDSKLHELYMALKGKPAGNNAETPPAEDEGDAAPDPDAVNEALKGLEAEEDK